LHLARCFSASGGHPSMIGQDILRQIVRGYLCHPARWRSGEIRFAAILRLSYAAVLRPGLTHSRRPERPSLLALNRLTRLRDITPEWRDDIVGPKHSRRLRSPVAVYLFHSHNGLFRTHDAMPRTARLCRHPCHPIIPSCGAVLPEIIFVAQFLSTPQWWRRKILRLSASATAVVIGHPPRDSATAKGRLPRYAASGGCRVASARPKGLPMASGDSERPSAGWRLPLPLVAFQVSQCLGVSSRW